MIENLTEYTKQNLQISARLRSNSPIIPVHDPFALLAPHCLSGGGFRLYVKFSKFWNGKISKL